MRRNCSKRWLSTERSYPEFSLPFKYSDLSSGYSADNIVSSEYGRRVHPTNPGAIKLHAGIDFLLPLNTPIYAPYNGTIARLVKHSSYGNVIIMSHDDQHENLSLYAHLDSISVEKNEKVQVGDLIGFSGKSGSKSTGAHLHFEMIDGSKLVVCSGEEKMAWRCLLDQVEDSVFIEEKRGQDTFALC